MGPSSFRTVPSFSVRPAQDAASGSERLGSRQAGPHLDREQQPGAQPRSASLVSARPPPGRLAEMTDVAGMRRRKSAGFGWVGRAAPLPPAGARRKKAAKAVAAPTQLEPSANVSRADQSLGQPRAGDGVLAQVRRLPRRGRRPWLALPG
ncbi:hypothetical protein BDY21DRAFT_366075 [Lineolata rhizophorae]|uniref:Uncharacterized protein n=1 Tax=Lineolata rhizophorae TaxID=578093 RepID=A0A6A6NSF6_9PEZI|nr:hypothetical protein BDY21DRAFT_366075 [Lineolata rhizophorae]